MLFRDLAQRLLVERNAPETRPLLEKLALDESAPRKTRLHALWSLVGAGPLRPEFHLTLLGHPEATFRAWGVRAAGNLGKVEPAVRQRIEALADDAAPDVKLQVAIAARKLDGTDPLPLLLRVLVTCGDDRLIPHIVWQNLHPLLETRAPEFLQLVKKHDLKQTPNLAKLMPRITEKILARGK